MASLVYPQHSREFSFHHPILKGKHVHPTVTAFKQMETEEIVARYCKDHKDVQREALLKVLTYKPEHFHWAGCDMFPGITATGRREKVVLEVNSCPAGQKDMPPGTGKDSTYHKLMETFLDVAQINCHPDLQNANLAVVHDKNPIENRGYATALADMTQEPVYFVELYANQKEPSMRWVDGVMEVKDVEGDWHSVRAALRYVVNKPWTRLPTVTKTILFNPVTCCLSGGRNKLVAAKAYEEFNKQHKGTGLFIRTPRTINGIKKDKIPEIVKYLGDRAVIKSPYSNSGQGVYTVTSKRELDDFMNIDFGYEKFIVQTLIGNENWSSAQWHHAGTAPDNDGCRYVYDLRMMIGSTPGGFRPLVIRGRRARLPMPDYLDGSKSSWDYLGTNVSIPDSFAVDGWRHDTGRLLPADPVGLNKMDLGMNDLIDGFIQAVMAVSAIDMMCRSLMQQDGTFDFDKYAKLVEDDKLLEEINSFS